MKHSVASDIKQSLKIPVAAVILHKPPIGLFLGIFFILTFYILTFFVQVCMWGQGNRVQIHAKSISASKYIA